MRNRPLISIPLISTSLISTSLNGRISMIIRAVLMITAAVAALSPVSADEVGAKNRKANSLYSKGQYEEALKLYDDALLLDPSNGKLKMNKGSTLYRLGELDEAEKSYQDAVASQSDKKDKKTLADAHYNLGNIRYKQAEKLESAGNAASARKKYSGALDSYINTLKLRPKDMDAKWNLQLAHQKIDLLKDQQDKNQDDNKDKDRQQDQNQQNDRQNGDKDDKDDKKDQDNKDQQDKKDQSDNKDQQDQEDKDQQGNEDQQRQPDKGDRNKEEAQRLIEQYADDSDTLNKPKFQRVRIRQPEKDW